MKECCEGECIRFNKTRNNNCDFNNDDFRYYSSCIHSGIERNTFKTMWYDLKRMYGDRDIKLRQTKTLQQVMNWMEQDEKTNRKK